MDYCNLLDESVIKHTKATPIKTIFESFLTIRITIRKENLHFSSKGSFTIFILYCLLYFELWSAFRIAYHEPKLPNLLFPSLPPPPICCHGSIIGRKLRTSNRNKYNMKYLTENNQTTMIVPSQQAPPAHFNNSKASGSE